jgi:hypothetical protein
MHCSVPLLGETPILQTSIRSNIPSRMTEEDELQRVLRISLEEEQARLRSTSEREREQREAIERANEQAIHLALQQSFEEFKQQQLIESSNIAAIEQANEDALGVAWIASLITGDLDMAQLHPQRPDTNILFMKQYSHPYCGSYAHNMARDNDVQYSSSHQQQCQVYDAVSDTMLSELDFYQKAKPHGNDL